MSITVNRLSGRHTGNGLCVCYITICQPIIAVHMNQYCSVFSDIDHGNHCTSYSDIDQRNNCTSYSDIDQRNHSRNDFNARRIRCSGNSFYGGNKVLRLQWFTKGRMLDLSAARWLFRRVSTMLDECIYSDVWWPYDVHAWSFHFTKSVNRYVQ